MISCYHLLHGQRFLPKTKFELHMPMTILPASVEGHTQFRCQFDERGLHIPVLERFWSFWKPGFISLMSHQRRSATRSQAWNADLFSWRSALGLNDIRRCGPDDFYMCDLNAEKDCFEVFSNHLCTVHWSGQDRWQKMDPGLLDLAREARLVHTNDTGH